MAQVTVTIDGKAYRMACEEGQEDHLTDLATRFDRYVGHLKGQFGEIGDLRITVMAGIMVMDEISELTRRVAGLETELEALRGSRETAMAATARTEESLAVALGEVTMRIQGLADKLSGRAPAELN
ncbi:cell division protein ZapA [Rhizobium sp. S152]|uniref:cell division protein ZapA n=1 Tax=Rhizobium sp. S152 TaxID=3055038 RepID=UPI0025A971F6|nr:cell division protein ZapA [Rhizobium sp. S152]MDM9625908.1 cell division protein ZapA [Rhizobium sp. S152]